MPSRDDESSLDISVQASGVPLQPLMMGKQVNCIQFVLTGTPEWVRLTCAGYVPLRPRQLCGERSAAQKKEAFMCGDLNMQVRWAEDGAGGVDEGISLSLGSRRAVMYKACVDIV